MYYMAFVLCFKQNLHLGLSKCIEALYTEALRRLCLETEVYAGVFVLRRCLGPGLKRPHGASTLVLSRPRALQYEVPQYYDIVIYK